MSDARAVHVVEPRFDVDALQTSNYSLNVAKSVIGSDGKPTYNILWKSSVPAPSTNVSWTTKYAFGWTSEQLSVGASVSISGDWCPFNKGESWTINSDGYYTKNASWIKGPPIAGYVEIVNKWAGGKLQVVIGVASGRNFDPIFIDPSQLFINGGTGHYSPQESIQTWYDTHLATATMIASDQGNTNTIDCSKPAGTTNNYEWWTSFSTGTNAWTTSESKPSQ